MVEVLPCYYHEDQFFVDDALREIYRREYQINGAQKLILYSGMLQKWQEPDLLFSFVKAIQEQDINNEARFLFLTFDRGTVQQFIGKYDLHNIIVASADDEQLNGFYNAADIGIAFRTNDMVSYVSSPVKIPEYLAAGNSVLLLEYIGDFGQELSDKGYALVKKDKNALLSTTLPELMKLTRPGSQDLVDIRENYNIHNNIEAITRIIKRMHEA